MALTADIIIEGDVAVAGAYIKVTGARIMCIEADGGKTWKLGYDVATYKSAEARATGRRMPCASIAAFKCDFDIEAGENPIVAAYADLKSRLEAAKDC